MSAGPLAALLASAAEALRPDPHVSVSEWADAFRVLDSGSARPGPWQTSFAPHTREPMDRLSREDPCRRLVLMWSSQSSKSEVFNNAIGCHIHTSPRPMMLVQPTITTVEEYGKQRLAPMFALAPPLAERVEPNVSRGSGNTLQLKQFPGGFLRLSGANSAASLASTPIGDLFCDEIDRYPDDADGEGDPVDLARKRVTTFAEAGTEKVALTSTPTVRDLSRIEAALNETDHNEWWVRCPHCGAEQILRWRLGDEAGDRRGEYRVTWPKGRPEEAVYVCEHGGCVLAEHERRAAARAGRWIPRCPEKSRGGRVRGYHFSAVSSPFVTLAMLAAEWEDCQGDPARVRVFVNTRLAETWDESLGTGAKAEGLLGRREPWVVCPVAVVLVTAAVDTQDDRLELGLVGWGAGEESWVLDHRVLSGEPSRPELWTVLDKLLTARVATQDGRQLPIAATCIDTGGHFADQAAQFCHGRDRRRIWAIKGSPTAKVIWPRRPGKTKNRLPVYAVGVSEAKEILAARLRRTTDGAGRIHFPERWLCGQECDEEYFRQLTSEKRIWKHGKIRWVKRSEGARNEAWDVMVYALAALRGLQHLGVRLPARREEAPPPAAEGGAVADGAAASQVPSAAQPPSSVPGAVAPPKKAPPRRPPPRRPPPRPRSLW